MFRAKLRTLVCKPPVNCSVTHKPLDNKNNGTCYDCYQFVIKRLIEIAETRINTGFFKQLDLFELIQMVVIKHINSLKKSEKFDAIVEKAGKVDANYAAQIEGYCSLLGEYGKKFEAVCAMLQPEKLRLSPDKYREKLEGINTGYQNAMDIHEQEQSAYEAELYEIETVWYKKCWTKRRII